MLWALELLQQCETFLGIAVFQFVGHLLIGSTVGLIVTFPQQVYAIPRSTVPRAPAPAAIHC